MKGFMGKVKSSAIISAVLFIILGALLIIFPQEMANIICYSIGTVVLIYGLILIVKYLADKERTSSVNTDLVMGIILCGVALFMFLSQALLSIVSMIFGLFLIIDGIINAQKSFELKKFGYEKWWIDFLFSLISAFAGILLIVKSDVIPEIALGIGLLYDGIMNLISIHGLSRIIKANKYIEDYETIDEEDL